MNPSKSSLRFVIGCFTICRNSNSAVDNSDFSDESRVTRHFFINKSYAGCPKDIGWFVVVDKRDVCAWARQGNVPVFLYNKSSKAANWNRSKFIYRVIYTV